MFRVPEILTVISCVSILGLDVKGSEDSAIFVKLSKGSVGYVI